MGCGREEEKEDMEAALWEHMQVTGDKRALSPGLTMVAQPPWGICVMEAFLHFASSACSPHTTAASLTPCQSEALMIYASRNDLAMISMLCLVICHNGLFLTLLSLPSGNLWCH